MQYPYVRILKKMETELWHGVYGRYVYRSPNDPKRNQCDYAGSQRWLGNSHGGSFSLLVASGLKRQNQITIGEIPVTVPVPGRPRGTASELKAWTRRAAWR
jgi:hypothetical protein